MVVKIEEIEIEIPGLPSPLHGFRIVHITDLHGRSLAANGDLVKSIAAFSPQFIALTGDYVSSSWREFPRITPFLQALRKISPTYAVSGNHDYSAGWPAIAAALREESIVVLENAHIIIEAAGEKLVLVGVNDPATGRDDLQRALPAHTNCPVIVLAHAPTWFELGRTEHLRGVDLVLSGHTHGGQIKIPGIGAVTNASGRLFPRAYVEGLSLEGSTWLYISRGLGYTGIPIRLMSPPELTLITLVSKKG